MLGAREGDIVVDRCRCGLGGSLRGGSGRDGLGQDRLHRRAGQSQSRHHRQSPHSHIPQARRSGDLGMELRHGPPLFAGGRDMIANHGDARPSPSWCPKSPLGPCHVRKIWRRDRESNPGARICSPLRHHSAIAPRCVGGGHVCGFSRGVNRGVGRSAEKVLCVRMEGLGIVNALPLQDKEDVANLIWKTHMGVGRTYMLCHMLCMAFRQGHRCRHRRHCHRPSARIIIRRTVGVPVCRKCAEPNLAVNVAYTTICFIARVPSKDVARRRRGNGSVCWHYSKATVASEKHATAKVIFAHA